MMSPNAAAETETMKISLTSPARMNPTAEHSLISMATVTFRPKARQELTKRYGDHWMVASTILGSHTKMFPMIKMSRHTGAMNMVYVKGSNLKLPPLNSHSPSTFFEHSPNCEI